MEAVKAGTPFHRFSYLCEDRVPWRTSPAPASWSQTLDSEPVHASRHDETWARVPHRLPPPWFLTRILVMRTQSLASVKTHFSAVVDSVHDTHERVIVTKNGEPSVVVVAVEDLESLEETLAILQDEKTMRALAQAEREVAAGETVDAEGLRDLMARRPRTS